jgi:hypothetical protein
MQACCPALTIERHQVWRTTIDPVKLTGSAGWRPSGDDPGKTLGV